MSGLARGYDGQSVVLGGGAPGVANDLQDAPTPPPVDAARTDLASQLGIEQSTITLISSDSVVWSDGSLGCPEPGRAYQQVVTPGYRIVLSANGGSYEYHSGRSGEPIFCNDPRPPLEGAAESVIP
jgi:hypothetical protein